MGVEVPKLGDAVERWLSAVGITEKAVQDWLGRPCGCAARKRKLNRLSELANEYLKGGSAEETKETLTNLME